ncbi:MAG: nucleotidyltransferase domain-containing protein [Euryarchaeota archaeon]|nr:nucleotidyltransferase domain-containing protein [Euryarchaeota archaeon]
MTSGPIKDIIKELKSGLEKKYGSQLKSILLFGSYARGEETEDSDIDIAAIPAMIVNAYKRGTVSLPFRKHLHHLFTI